jgi:signal peptidase II
MDAAQAVRYLLAAAGSGENTRRSGTLKMQDALRGRSFGVLMGIAFIALDQLIKLLALFSLQATTFRFGSSPVNMALELSLNPGAFLSLGAGLPPQVKQLIFIVGVAAVVCWAGYWAWKNWNHSLRKAAPLFLIALGGTGNLIDRVFRDGHVVDYMVVNVGSLHTGVFNLADIAITLGALLLMVDLFKNPGNV